MFSPRFFIAVNLENAGNLTLQDIFRVKGTLCSYTLYSKTSKTPGTSLTLRDIFRVKGTPRPYILFSKTLKTPGPPVHYEISSM